MRLELLDDQAALAVVHRPDLAEKACVIAVVLGRVDQRREVLAQTRPAPPHTGCEVRLADPAVQTHGIGDGTDVDTGRGADVRDLVGKAHLERQKGVRRVLDHLGGGDRRAHQHRPPSR